MAAMTIDWNAFTPGSALAGGALIGAAAAVLLLLNGRIAGISGILGGLLSPRAGDIQWRVAFVLGLVMAPLLYRAWQPLPEVHVEAGYGVLVVAGLLVGVGTRYASGCTSGHGVCGLSRLSARSLSATLVFVATGVATVFAWRHLLSL
jgi:uncharacterized membrane protein YedE/YeeE